MLHHWVLVSFIFIQGKGKVPVHLCRKGAARCWKWKSHIYMSRYCIIHYCFICKFKFHFTSNKDPWYPFIHCDFHSHLHPTSDRYTGNLCSFCIIVIILTSLPINVVNWPYQYKMDTFDLDWAKNEAEKW